MEHLEYIITNKGTCHTSCPYIPGINIGSAACDQCEYNVCDIPIEKIPMSSANSKNLQTRKRVLNRIVWGIG